MSPLSPQDEQAEIIQATLRLYRQFGPGKVSMDDVAKATGRSRTSIYYYFKNRDEMFRAAVDAIVLEMAKDVRKAVADVRLPGDGRNAADGRSPADGRNVGDVRSPADGRGGADSRNAADGRNVADARNVAEGRSPADGRNVDDARSFLDEQVYTFCVSKLKVSREWKLILDAIWVSMDQKGQWKQLNTAESLHQKLVYQESLILKEMLAAAEARKEIRVLSAGDIDRWVFVITSGIRGIRNELPDHNVTQAAKAAIRVLSEMATGWLRG
jgi:AcrR family transcriptional regulator